MNAESATHLEEPERLRQRFTRNQHLFDAPPHTLRHEAIRIALTQTRSRTSWVDSADLASAGHLGFQNALRTFDPDSVPPRPFRPYAIASVRNAMRAEANRQMPRSIRQHLRSISNAERDLSQQLKGKREPTEDEVAASAGLAVETIRAVRRALPVISPVPPLTFESAEWGSDEMAPKDVDDDEETKRAKDAKPIGGFSYTAEDSGLRSYRNPREPGWELVEALSELPAGDRRVIQEIIRERDRHEDSASLPVSGRIRLERKRAKDRCFASVIRKILDGRMSKIEQATFAERYRNGRFRREPGPLEIAAFRGLRARLLANDLLNRIFSVDALDVLTKRYEQGWSIEQIAGSKQWSESRCLMAEFAEMQKVVELVLPLDKKHEFQHAVLPDQLDVARRRFSLGQEPRVIASDRGLTEERVSADLYATGEAVLWLNTHPRYLNLGRHPLTTDMQRALLESLFGEGTSPTDCDVVAISQVFVSVFNFEPQVQQ